jgi:hypothetical protein
VNSNSGLAAATHRVSAASKRTGSRLATSKGTAGLDRNLDQRPAAAQHRAAQADQPEEGVGNGHALQIGLVLARAG